MTEAALQRSGWTQTSEIREGGEWTEERKQALQKFADERGGEPSDLDVQMAFFAEEAWQDEAERIVSTIRAPRAMKDDLIRFVERRSTPDESVSMLEDLCRTLGRYDLDGMDEDE